MLYSALALAALLVSASAAPAEQPKCPQTICVDKISPCGVKYGSCYDLCDPDPTVRPTPPPCPASYSSALLTPTPSISADNCSTRSVCADYINECGIWYGGCFADCTPWPTFSKPPCPNTTSTSNLPVFVTTTETLLPPSVVTTFTTNTDDTFPTPTSSDCHDQTICADYINDCGQLYGGCFSACTPWPVFTPPPCPSSNNATTTTVTATSGDSSGGALDPVLTATTITPTLITPTPILTTSPTPDAVTSYICTDLWRMLSLGRTDADFLGALLSGCDIDE
ncbi:hypothetical protein G7054_g1589 [Neopestalotiopsis clavispora]|nr:hypothetical protein G7054_g1589 [Neopestalotiopsis clavispora]